MVSLKICGTIFTSAVCEVCFLCGCVCQLVILQLFFTLLCLHVETSLCSMLSVVPLPFNISIRDVRY